MQQIYNNCIKKLENFKNTLISEDDFKRGKLYFSWLINKTEKIKNEQNKMYIYNNLLTLTLPKYDINLYIYNKANDELKNIIKENYYFDGKKYKFFNQNITYKEVMLLSKYIILKRGNVVWIDFGFNIGNEFGGVHPAVILKNFEKELFVLPISSQKPIEFKNIEKEYICNNITFKEFTKQKNNITEIVQLNKIFGFKDLVRFGNITRIKKISILRLDFSGSIGSITGKDLDIISEKIKKEF